MASGEALIALCKTHVRETMAALPECAAEAAGLGNKAIEEAAGLGLNLPAKDGWFTWSILFALVLEGQVEVVQARPNAHKKYRLT